MKKYITNKELISEGYLYLENLKEGRENCETLIIRANSAEKLFSFLRTLFDENTSISFGDFLYKHMTEKEEQRMVNGLSKNEFELYKGLKNSDAEYVVLNENTLEILFEISIREWLFFTFYFKEPQITLWANYNKSFIMFYKSGTYIEHYKKLAQDKGCEVEKWN
ncbi:MAG: hypothetical protein ACK5LL_02475 [Suipraeoptans sp.]